MKAIKKTNTTNNTNNTKNTKKTKKCNTSNDKYLELDNIKLCSNISILNNYNSYKAKNEMIMYHITSKPNALSILQNGFDISKCGEIGTSCGKGINLSSKIDHLQHYCNDKTRIYYIIKCLVKFNKKKKNYTKKNSTGKDIYIKKNDCYNHTIPEYNKPPAGYNALYVPGPEIYVIPTSQQVYPILIGKVNKNTFAR